jgi:sec-independent protein translocase protein TatA
MIGSQDLLIGLAIVLILFGAKRLPELASSLGKSMKEFRKGVAGGADDEPSKPESAAVATVAAARVCVSCKTPLEAEWTHCPRCGGAAPPASAPVSQG